MTTDPLTSTGAAAQNDDGPTAWQAEIITLGRRTLAAKGRGREVALSAHSFLRLDASWCNM